MKARRRDAEIRQHRVAILVEQDIVWFHVAMHHAASVCVVQRARYLRRDGSGARRIDGAHALDQVSEGAAIEIRHHRE